MKTRSGSPVPYTAEDAPAWVLALIIVLIFAALAIVQRNDDELAALEQASVTVNLAQCTGYHAGQPQSVTIIIRGGTTPPRIDGCLSSTITGESL